jgi:hypothetical protein
VSYESLTYSDLAARLGISTEAARALARRLRLPRSRGNDGKTLLTVDLDELRHKPLPVRAPGGDRAVTGMVATLKARIAELEAELVKAERSSAGHREDFERERSRTDQLMSELLTMVGEMMSAKERAAQLEGEIAALRTIASPAGARPDIPRTWREMNWRERVRWLRSTG